MSDNFDWRTEEDGDWDGFRPGQQRKGGRRRWIWLLAILVIAIAVGTVIYWQVQLRLSLAEATVSDEIISSFHLVRQAEAQGDIELFRNLLSGSDLEWATAQQDLFARGWLFDLSSFGLAREPTAVTEVTAALNPSMSSAEVSALTTYAPAGPATETDAVQLLQNGIYRRGERWVWSPPTEDYWAGEATADEEFLSVTYPKRDQDLALRLAGDLDSLLSRVCSTRTGLECPDRLLVDITFSHEPSVLLEMGERFAAGGLYASRLSGQSGASQGLEMILPTPALLGLPVDEAGYRALLRGYGSHLVIALADRFVDPECCGTEARARAATRKMLQDLDLNVWSADETAAAIFRDGASVGEQVALLCSDGYERHQKLYLLDLAQMAWREQVMQTDLVAVKAVPDGDGVLLLGQSEAQDGLHSQVWRHSNAGSVRLFDLRVSEAEAERVSWEVHERQGLLVIEVPDVTGGYSRYFTIDLGECGQGECPATPNRTVNRPVWSPDGSQMMVRAFGLLWSRAGDSMVPIADGSAPFWVDDETYGYARSFGREQAIVLATPGDDQEEQVILTTNDLRSVLEPGSQRNRLLVGRIMVSQPADVSRAGEVKWLILAFEIGRDGSVSEALFFAFDPQSAAVEVIPHSGRLLSFNLSPSGDWMAIGGFADDEGRWLITVLDRDLEATTMIPLESGGSAGSVPSYSWSQDETWLMMLEQGLLTLHNPASDGTYKFRPPDASCVQAAWYGTEDFE